MLLKIFKQFTSLFMICCILTACGNKDDTLKIGVCADNGAYSSIQNGKFYGYEIELAELIAKSLQKKYQFIDLDFHTIIVSVQNGDVDFAIASITKNIEREKYVSFSDEYLKHDKLICMTTDMQAPDIIDNIQDLDKHENLFIVQTGSTFEAIIKNNIKKGIFKSIDRLFQIKQEIEDNNMNIYILCDPETLKTLYSMNKYNKEIKLIEIKYNNISGYSIAVNKNNKELSQEINHYLRSPQYQEDQKMLLNKYFPKTETSVDIICPLQNGQKVA